MALLPYTVGSPSTVYDQTARNAVGVHWHDTPLGPFKASNGSYRTFASSPGASPPYRQIMQAIGTQNLPASISHASITISGVPSDFGYCGGGCILEHADYDFVLAVVHLERWPGNNPTPYYSSYGLLKSSDDGDSFAFLGEVVGCEHQFNDAEATSVVNPGMGNSVRVGNYFYCYLMEHPAATFPDSRHNYLTVARANADALFASADADGTGTWQKWDGSGWTEDPLTGLGAPLTGLPVGRHFIAYTFDVSVHAPTGIVIMTTTGSVDETNQSAGDQPQFADDWNNFYITMSRDGLNWTDPVVLLSDATIFNTAILWPGYVTSRSGGGSFNLFFTKDVSIWDNVVIRKLLVTLNIGSRRTGGNKFRGGVWR